MIQHYQSFGFILFLATTQNVNESSNLGFIQSSLCLFIAFFMHSYSVFIVLPVLILFYGYQNVFISFGDFVLPLTIYYSGALLSWCFISVISKYPQGCISEIKHNFSVVIFAFLVLNGYDSLVIIGVAILICVGMHLYVLKQYFRICIYGADRDTTEARTEFRNLKISQFGLF